MKAKPTQHINNIVKSRIYGHGRGWCFSLNDFLDLKSNEAVRQVVVRLTKSGLIRRIANGLYEYPRRHPRLGILPPKIENVRKAIMSRSNIRLQPSGAYAANIIGFSEQVPAKVVFLTDGNSRRFKVDNQEIILKHASAKSMAMADMKAGILVQALKFIGNKHITPGIRKNTERVMKQLSNQEKNKLMKYSPAWIRKLLQEYA